MDKQLRNPLEGATMGDKGQSIGSICLPVDFLRRLIGNLRNVDDPRAQEVKRAIEGKLPR